MSTKRLCPAVNQQGQAHDNATSPPTGLSLGTPPVNKPPIGGAEPDGLDAPLPLVPPAAVAPPPLGSENQNQWTGE